MNRESPNQDSKVLQILDDIDRVKSCEFSQDSFSEMLNKVEWQFTGDNEYTSGRAVSNDAVQAYLGQAVDDAVHTYLKPTTETVAGATYSPQAETLAGGINDERLAEATEREREDQERGITKEEGSLRWLPIPTPSSGSQSVTPTPTDDEHEDETNTAMDKNTLPERTWTSGTAKMAPYSAIGAPQLPPAARRTLEQPVAFRDEDALFGRGGLSNHHAGNKPAAFRDEDVLFGRGGLSNHHAGNKRYREEVERIKPTYRQEHLTKKQKTEIRNQLVDTVRGYGGRFLKYSEKGGWEEVPLQQARKKVSQALREEKRKGGTK